MKVVIKDVQNLRENGAYVAPNITELHQANYGYDLLLGKSCDSGCRTSFSYALDSRYRELDVALLLHILKDPIWTHLPDARCRNH